MSNRLFVVTIGKDSPRLIEAPSKKAAIQFCLPAVIQAEVAKAAVVAQMMAKGCVVEIAKGE